jgi:hypothetical protein
MKAYAIGDDLRQALEEIHRVVRDALDALVSQKDSRRAEAVLHQIDVRMANVIEALRENR